jgi:hypothetical protein
VREAGRLAADHADAGAPIVARHELLDLGVVETRGRPGAVLGEHLGEVAAVVQRGAQGPFQDVSFDHPTCLLIADGSRHSSRR